MRRASVGLLVAVGMVAMHGHARAASLDEPARQPLSRPPPATADDAQAPCAPAANDRPPDLACGEALDGRAEPSASSSLAVPRAVLWVPRAAAQVVLWPVLTASDLIEHHHLFDWMTAVLTTDDRLVGVRPELSYSTDFLPAIGLRVFDRRLPGEGSEVAGRFLTAGPSIVLVETRLRTSDRVGLTIGASLNRRDDRLFAGIGPNSAADLQAQGRALARYGSNVWMTELRWSRRLPWRLAADLHGDLQRRDYEADSVNGGPSVATIFGRPPGQCAADGLPAACVDDALVPGFSDGTRIAHAGADLVLDFRDHARDGSGLSAAAAATFAQGLGGDPSRHVMLLGETVLAWGGRDRVLLLRGRAAMIEPLTSAPVPFDELVSPAGQFGMRGFSDGRFRGESGLVGTAEYRYYIASTLDASVFTDVGTVAGRRFSGLRGDRWFPDFGVGFRLYVPEGPYWEAVPHTGLQLAYAPDAGLRVMLNLAGF
jgi:hypothetical protein